MFYASRDWNVGYVASERRILKEAGALFWLFEEKKKEGNALVFISSCQEEKKKEKNARGWRLAFST